MRSGIFAVAAATATAAFSTPLYTPTPAGDVLSHCVREVPHMAHAEEQPDGSTRLTLEDGSSSSIPKCDTTVDGVTYPVLRRRGAAAAAAHNATTGAAANAVSDPQPNPLPADYDGWLQYTAFEDAQGFDSFVGEMSVPDVPAAKPQILYLFPGVQNIDWIPKVDPEPTQATPFDILQPVLQFPGSGFKKSWAVKSWYVTVNAGALYSSPINVASGDAILCNMTRTGPTSWFVGSKVKSSGKETNQRATNARLAKQPWAYNTLECYGCQGCATYPKNPVTFTDLKLFKGGADVTSEVKWLVNPKPQADQKCKEATTVNSASDVAISFQ